MNHSPKGDNFVVEVAVKALKTNKFLQEKKVPTKLSTLVTAMNIRKKHHQESMRIYIGMIITIRHIGLCMATICMKA